jgi:hypothetical protein
MWRQATIITMAFAVTVWGDAILNLGPNLPLSGPSSLNGVDQGYIGGTLFSRNFDQSSGTGVIEPFLRLCGGGQDWCEGFNTGVVHPPLDDKAGKWTHDLLFSSLVKVTLGNVSYYEFMLDINQTGQITDTKYGQLLSLDQVQIYRHGTSDLTLTGFESLPAANLVYQMNAGTSHNFVIVDNTKGFDISGQLVKGNGGSGEANMLMFVPEAYFAGKPGDYVTLYSKFGTGQYTSGNKTYSFKENDGFEEWHALRGQAQVVPEPGSTWLIGTGVLLLSGCALLRRRFTR